VAAATSIALCSGESERRVFVAMLFSEFIPQQNDYTPVDPQWAAAVNSPTSLQNRTVYASLFEYVRKGGASA
jgi:hypothetical protein